MFLPEQTQQPQAGVAAVTPANPETTTEDIALMQRVLAAASRNPNLIPSDFMAYMVDFIQTSRLSIPIGQVFGFTHFLSTQVSVYVGTGTTSLVFPANTVESGSGPSAAALPPGKYVLFAGFDASGVNSPTLTLSDGLTVNGATGSFAKGESFSLSAASTTITSTLSGQGAGAGGSITGAWIIVVRYDNA